MSDNIVGKVALGLTLNKKAFTNEIDNVAKYTENTMGNAFKKVGGLLAAGFGVTKLLQFGKECLNLGSDLAEVQNVVDVTFPHMTAKVNEFAQNAIEQFGLSETVAKQYMGQLGAMAKAFGYNEAAAYDMAEALTGLTGDVASFYNLSTDEAFTKLKSVFTGETESLKSLGVVMTQTALDEYALANGFGMTTSAMTEQEKVMLRLEFVTNALSGAAGDFSRTSDGWANSTRVLALRFNQLKATLGQGFINILAPLVQWINLLISKLQTLANYFLAFTKLITGKGGGSGVAGAMAATADSAGGLADNLAGASGGAGGLAGGLGRAADNAKKLKGFLAGFDNLTVLKSQDTSDSGGSGGSGGGGSAGGGGGLSAGDMDLGTGSIDTTGVDEFYEKVKAVFDKVVAFLTKNKAIILSLLSGIAAGFATFEIMMNWPRIVSGFSQMIAPLQWLGTAFEVLWTSITNGEGIFVGFQAVFGTAAGTAALVAIGVAAVTAALVYLYQISDSFRALVNDAVAGLFSILQSLYDSILKPIGSFLLDLFNTVLMPLANLLAKVFVKAVELIFSAVLALWNNVLVPVAKFLISVLAIAIQAIINVWEGWKPLIESIIQFLLDLWDHVLSPLADYVIGEFLNAFDSFGKFIEELIPSLTEIFQGFADFFAGVFTLDVDRAWRGITEIFRGFDTFLTTVFEKDYSNSFGKLGTVMNVFMKIIQTVWETIKELFDGAIQFIKGAFTGNWRSAWEGVVKIFGSIFEGLAGLLKGPINAVISIVNWAINRINGIGFDIPDWVPGIGGRSFRVNVPNIPMLAEGGYVGANQPQLAMIGDNKYEGEVVAPESKIYDQAKAAVDDSLLSNVAALLDVLYEILDAIRNLGIDVDPDVLIRIIDKRRRQNELARGGAV